MSERDILIRALRASGSEREAQLAEAILGDPAPTPAATPTPDPARPAAGDSAPGQAPGQLPEGVMSLEEIDAWERRPAPKSGAEQQEGIAQTDRVFESLKYHQEQR